MLGQREASALIVLLVVLAVATVLISPDPTDDVDGVLYSHKLIKIPALFPVPNLTLTAFTHFKPLPSVASTDFSSRLCGLRC